MTDVDAARETRTPLGASLPRILIHARGKLDASEVSFWGRLRADLREQGYELFLITHNAPQVPADVPVLRVPNGCDRAPQIGWHHGWRSWLDESSAPVSLDYEPLLERERWWWGDAADEEHGTARREALAFFDAFYRSALASVKPVLCVIWNGTHAQEMILEQRCREAGCPVAYIERAPFRDFVHLDPAGILGGSAAAKLTDWSWESEEGHAQGLEAMQRVTERYRESGGTWWQQPESVGGEQLRQKLGIRPEEKVALFAGQVDADAQNFFFPSHFENNLGAVRWLSEALAKYPDVYFLGKHHPMNCHAPDEFATAIAGRGSWQTDISMSDALGLADRVAAVNSTVLYEGLLLDKPVLSMGESLLRGKNICYEASPGEDSEAAIKDWLESRGFDDRLDRWKDFGAWMLAHGFYTMRAAEDGAVGQGTAPFASALASLAAEPADVEHSPIEIPWFFLEEPAWLYDATAATGPAKPEGTRFARWMRRHR